MDDSQAFGPHSDLTYRVIEDVSLDSTDLRQCLFTGAVFRRVKFENVNFRRSDFDAARFESCEFIRCDLSIDIRSTLFVDVSFVECIVGTAFVTDCSFSRCRFVGIHFDDCAMAHNDFESCSFDDCSLTQSTFVHNTVRRSSFSATNLGDCTFLYVIMTSCSFNDCTMNLESVGMIYGLTLAELHAFRYVHLGVEQTTPAADELLHTLLQQYEQRRWRIGVAVMRLNFRITAPLYAFHQYLTATNELFLTGTPLNREEMLFVAKLMTELGGESRLPLATCFDVSRWCSVIAEAARERDATDVERTLEVLRELSSRALALSHEGLRRIEISDPGRVLADGVDAPAVAKLVFGRRPAVDVAELMSNIAAQTGLIIYGRSTRLRSHSGSWIEYVQTTVLSLAAIRVFFYFINGVLYDVTEARARYLTLTKARLPREFIDVALRPQAPISTALIAPLKALAAEALRTSWVDDPTLAGLSPDNVKTVAVIDDLETHTNDAAPQ